MEESISDDNIPWDELKNSSVLITGATGTIGSAIVRTLFAANEKYKLGVKILAFGRNKGKAKPLIEKYGAKFYAQDICEPFAITEDIDYMFHCAATTRSAKMQNLPAELMIDAACGTKNLLDLAKAKGVKSIVFLSSMEVYGQKINGEVTENDLGHLDLTNPRSSYPESKRFCEMLCNAYYTQFGVPVKSARLAQTFGAEISKDDTRVFAQFTRSILAKKDIVLHTEGKSRGNYCYIDDAIRALFILLLKGENGQSYNIANPAASMTIREMANLLAKKFGLGVRVEIPENIRELGYAPDSGYILNIDKISNLAWKPRYGLVQMYERILLHCFD
jgi:nucleoside-diphosphate-sugar epimerase